MASCFKSDRRGEIAPEIRIDDMSLLSLDNVRTETTTNHGKVGLKMIEKFGDGDIDREVSGAPSKTADPNRRGFIGVMFRVQADGSHAESIYLRPSNGRADYQLNLNHSVNAWLCMARKPSYIWRAPRSQA